MAIHYLTSRQAQRVGRAVNKVESSGQRSEFKQENLQAQNALIVTVQEDIEAKTSGDATIMRGLVSSLNESTDPRITVWNLSEVDVLLGEVVLAIWTLSENSFGSWVIIVPSFTSVDSQFSGGTTCIHCLSGKLLGRIIVEFRLIKEPDPVPTIAWVSGIAEQINGFHTLTRPTALGNFDCLRVIQIELVDAAPFIFFQIGLYILGDQEGISAFYIETALMVESDIVGQEGVGVDAFGLHQQHGFTTWTGRGTVFGTHPCTAKETIFSDDINNSLKQWDLTEAVVIVNPRSAVSIGGQTQVENITPPHLAFTSDAFTIAWDDDNGTSWDVYLTEEGDTLTSVSVGQGTKTFAASALTAGSDYLIGIVGSDGTNQSYKFSQITVIHNMYGSITVEGNSTVTTISSSSSDFTNKVQVTVFDTDGAENDVDADHTNDHISITTAGTYQCEARVSASGTATDKISLAIFKNNGATQLGPRSTNAVFAAAETISISSGPIVLSATDTVELWGQNEDSTDDFTIQDGSLTVYRVG